MDLSLDVCHSTSVKDALARFFQPEILDGSNKYSCERCLCHKPQMFLSYSSKCRFEGIGGKINRNIEFEEVLLLSSFMFNGNQVAVEGLRLIIKKELTVTDVGPLKRIVLPKASYFQENFITTTFEVNLPVLKNREGRNLRMHDIETFQLWEFKYK
ncbi:Ubiquitin carboxyl-terminal hydrolase 25 [Carex littledalei]|uniref:Ubiquitin carboxyl-terminal hydrolase 25 n=1 Tax=Carex littledalei TaxID=544730 RepID=A0A833R667_9POAL|nr:Ubiquitin carboxyl-terminal hydrolase 25 [Carex littledalei]